MIIVIEKPEWDTKTAIFGVNDFSSDVDENGDDIVSAWFHRSVDTDNPDEQYVNVNGSVVFATEEATKIQVDLEEVLADHIFYDTEVIIGLTTAFSETLSALRSLKNDETINTDSIEYVGDASLIE